MASEYQQFAQRHLRAGKSMKQVGALWRQHKGQGKGKGRGMTGGGMGAMSGGGSAKPKQRRHKGPVRPIGVPAGRGNTAYMPGTLAGAGLTPANEIIGGGFGDDILDGLGKAAGVAVKFAPLIPLFL